ncbi:hypothetical protein AB852_09165 [Streptomyces uncialis]|uniref:Uncharacterized protein n=1 Tax=Streptomyces uncialis TaxID=1048205 RepID=A0A1Q4V9C3_9ACTN|nr:hypothetical protein AB852_09165 [Streptomyces uncialis]
MPRWTRCTGSGPRHERTRRFGPRRATSGGRTGRSRSRRWGRHSPRAPRHATLTGEGTPRTMRACPSASLPPDHTGTTARRQRLPMKPRAPGSTARP